jgi:hypothetical protein
MALIPVTIFGAQFTSSEVTFLASIADHTYTDGQLIIGNGSTGGISFATLTQGSGITITNGHGTITIAASVSGFTKLTATGVPNGSLSSFVFSAAATQPSYIVSDGVWYESVDEASNTNWTWNGGTKTATLSMPPPSRSIFAVV